MKEFEIKLAQEFKLNPPKWVSAFLGLASILGILNTTRLLVISENWIISTILILSYPALEMLHCFSKFPYVFIASIPMLFVIALAFLHASEEFEKSIWFWSLATPSLVLFGILLTRASRATKKSTKRRSNNNGRIGA